MAGPKTAPLEPKIVERLLDLLGDSDKFRELFQRNPMQALELIGYQEPVESESLAADSLVPSGGAPLSIASCISVSELASKEAIQTARNEIRSMLLGGLNHTTPQLDATLSDSRRTLK